MSAIQAMMERELGCLVLELLEKRNTADLVVPAAEQRALGIIQAIQMVLKDPVRTDFDCVEEIVSILEHAGIPTDRHDFG